MALSYSELRELDLKKLIELHDHNAKSMSENVEYYLNEIGRRDQKKITDLMLAYTKWITLMTVIITIFTILNIILYFC